MKLNTKGVYTLLSFLAGVLCLGSTATAQTAELDAYWTEVSRTVREGDLKGYAVLYHDDAVLVSNFSESSVPIASALEGWKQGFMDTKAGKMAADVTFRFSQRYSDGKTAHETGIFRYVATPKGGEMSEQFIHFEGLLVKKDAWLMMMEFQKSPATKEEWDALQ